MERLADAFNVEVRDLFDFSQLDKRLDNDAPLPPPATKSAAFTTRSPLNQLLEKATTAVSTPTVTRSPTLIFACDHVRACTVL